MPVAASSSSGSGGSDDPAHQLEPPDEQVRALRIGRLDVRLDWLLGIATATAVFFLLVLHSADILSGPAVLWGDHAANQLLIDRALEGRLLTGHYSRGAFSHPGPVYLYVQAGGELVFHRWSGWSESPYGGWVLAVAALNSALIGWATTIACRRTRSVLLSCSLPLIALLLATWAPGLLTNDWGPALNVVPFLLLLVSGIYLARGHRTELLAFTTAGCLLVHGHVSSVVFVAGACLAVAAARPWRRDGHSPTPSRAQLIAAGAVVAVFSAPIALHVLTQWPGEFGRYLRYASESRSVGSAGVGDVVGFTSDTLLHGPVQTAALVGAVAITVLVAWRGGLRRPLARSVLAMSIGQSVLFALFVWRGVDDLSFDYLGWFAMSISIAMLWFGASLALGEVGDRFGRTWFRALAIALILGLALAVPGGQFERRLRDEPQVTMTTDAIGTVPTRLTFQRDAWPFAVSVVAAAKRQGRSVCILDAHWTYMVTTDHICSATDTSQLVQLSTPGLDPPPSGERLVERDGYTASLVEVPAEL